EFALARGGEHLQHSVAAVREGGVDVKRAAERIERDQRTRALAAEVVPGLAALGRHVREAGTGEEILFLPRLHNLAERLHELRRPGRPQHVPAEVARRAEME